VRPHRTFLIATVLLFATAIAASAQTAAQTPTLSDPALDLPSGSDPALNLLPPDWTPPPDGQGRAPAPPIPLPPPLFTPPAIYTGFVPSDDYPPESRRLGDQGIVRLRLLVTGTGEFPGCSIEATSGYPRLDEAACALVGRWKYKPSSETTSSYVTVNLIFHIPPRPRIVGDPTLNVPERGAIPQPAPEIAEAVLARFTHPQPITSHAITVDDYPADSIRMQEQGAIRLAFMIGERGDVSECAVEASSGYPRLDAAACAMVIGRWKYKPATLDGKTTSTINTANVVYLLR
jgi:TonB family protein